MRLLLVLFVNGLCYSQGQEIPAKDGVIHFESYGKGKPILIINGGPGMNSVGFRNLASILGKSNQAIIYDQRGTGKSIINKIDASTITMDNMVQDIETLRQHLNIDEWVVMGQSFGGMLASYYATKHPERISGLILSSSGGINLTLFSSLNITSRLSSENRDSLTYWYNKIQRGDTTYHARLMRGKYLAPAYVYDESNVNVIAERLTQGNMAINVLVFQDMRRIGFDCTSALKKFDRPVLILQGEEDIIDESLSEYAHKTFPNSQLIILEQCGHYGWLDQPEQYFKAVGGFLSQF